MAVRPGGVGSQNWYRLRLERSFPFLPPSLTPLGIIGKRLNRLYPFLYPPPRKKNRRKSIGVPSLTPILGDTDAQLCSCGVFSFCAAVEPSACAFRVGRVPGVDMGRTGGAGPLEFQTLTVFVHVHLPATSSYFLSATGVYP